MLKRIKQLNSRSIINLVGNKSDVEQAGQEINTIAKSYGLTTKFVNVKPNYCIAHSQTNKMPEWRIQLEDVLSNSKEDVLINKIGLANSEAINDLNRSVRALTYDTIHPWAFLVDPDVDSRHKSTLLKSNNSACGYSNPYNQVYPLKGTMGQKYEELEKYF